MLQRSKNSKRELAPPGVTAMGCLLQRQPSEEMNFCFFVVPYIPASPSPRD